MSVLYPIGKKAILDGEVAMLTDTIKAALVDTGVYTYSAAHDFLDDLTGIVGTAVTLGTKTTTAGVFDAADSTFTAVTGATVEAIVIYKDTGGSPDTSQLLAYIDSGTGLPVTPNGGDITIAWNASGIFGITDPA